MEIHGFYTQKGLALAAKLAAGIPLTISAIAAGSGQTSEFDSALSTPKQSLLANAPLYDKNTAAITATLVAAQAAENYTLTEVGVYAQDPDEGEILYKIYRLTAPVGIAAGSRTVLRFYLEETVSGAEQVTVLCSPAGLITEADFSPVRERVLSSYVSGNSVSMDAAELPAYIASLPRFLTEILYIVVTGTLDEKLVLKGFHGSGQITIMAEAPGNAELRGGIEIISCSLKIELANLRLQMPAAASEWTNLIYASVCTSAKISSCELLGSGVGRAVCAEQSSLYLYECSMAGFALGLLASASSVVSAHSVSAQDNQTGIDVWAGGAVLLGGSTPTLLGGNANSKNGGLIAAANGTLL